MEIMRLQGKTAAFTIGLLLLGFGFYSGWETQEFLKRAVPLEGTIRYGTKRNLMVECAEPGGGGTRIIEVRRPALSMPWTYRFSSKVSIMADLSGASFADFNPFVRARARFSGVLPLWGVSLLSVGGGLLLLALGFCMLLLSRQGHQVLFDMTCQTNDRPPDGRSPKI